MKQRPSVPITLYPSRRQAVLYMGSCALVGAFGQRIEPPIAAVVWVTVCMLLFLAVALRLVPSLAFLNLTEEGFSYRLGRNHGFVRWPDVAEVKAREMTTLYGTRRYVEWTYVRRYEELPSAQGRRYTFGGGAGILPDNFGMKNGELAELMNGLRTRYGRVPIDESDG